MSMNLHLEASTFAIFELKGKSSKRKHVVETFNLRQTPTEVSYRCYNAKDTYKEYCDWLTKEISCPYSLEHLEELDKWLKEHEGWTITWEVW